MLELLPYIAGWVGSGLIFLTYIALTRKWIKGDGNVYQFQVIAVSLAFGYMNWSLGVIPAIPINVLFGCIATAVLLRRLALRNRDPIPPNGNGLRTSTDEESNLGTGCRCGASHCKDRDDRVG